MSAIAKRAHKRLDALELAAKLVDKWRKAADKKGRHPKPNAFCDSWTLGLRAGETHAFNRCANQLAALLRP